jgi:4-hydroxy-tetrahydrodipicolinate reductase
MKHLALVGAGGRMGCRLDALATASDDLEVAARVDAGQTLESTQSAASIAAVIDFSVLSQVRPTLDWASNHGIPVVLGTTGLEAEHRAALEEAATTIPVVWAPNYAVGVNALFAVAGELARLLGEDWDLEIVEAHHRQKVDAPSGTARRIAELLAGSRGATYDEVARSGRDGQIGPRSPSEIGMSVVRGGDVVGSHDVLYLGEGEQLTLSHRATDRDIFARGALRAARWLLSPGGRAPGLYDMGDVLRVS